MLGKHGGGEPLNAFDSCIKPDRLYQFFVKT
jgi:hypothetical protein